MTSLAVEPKRQRIDPRWIALLIAAATLLCYWPALGGDFLWDDQEYIANNPTLRSIGGLWQIWTRPGATPQYYPLVFSSFWIEFHLWGLHTVGYHLINLALHIASALMIWRIMNRLGLPGGALAAAIFALHPVNVESVAWMSERKNCLSTLLYLAATNIYLQPFTRKRWGITLALFIAALLSKSVTASWPAAMLVIFWWRDRRIRWMDVARLLPFFVLAGLSGFLTAWVEHSSVGADARQIAELNFTIAERVLIAGRAVWFYAMKLLLPGKLTFIYPRWRIDPQRWWQWLFPAGALVMCAVLVVVTLARSFSLAPVRVGECQGEGENSASETSDFDVRERSSRSPQPSPPRTGAKGKKLPQRYLSRGWLACVLLFIGTLFPALGFINVYPMRYTFVADHFQYLATPMLIVPIAVLLTRWFRRAAVIVLIPLAVLTLMRTPVFSGPLPLWADTYSKNPDSWMVCTNLANALNRQQQYAMAGNFFMRAYELSPQRYETQTNASLVFAQRGQPDRAIALLESSARLKPEFPYTYYAWGQVLENSGDLAGAVAKYQTALELQPDLEIARRRLEHVQLQLKSASPQSGGDAAR